MIASRTASLAACSCALLGLGAPTSAAAQESDGWNAPAALELIAQARDMRQTVAGDPGLRSYQANATGRVFFLVDRPDSDQRTLVKADQIALEVYWRAPRQTRQRIVGQRDEEVLPTNIRYHLDHLTVVQDDFGDRIRLGDGDEVAAVVHPAAPGAEAFYDFRLGDSLTITFPGTDLQVRVNEVQVRPRRMDEPGFVGSVYLDRSSAAIVRMTFTFTPASYVDRYLDYIRISLDNSLWEGEWWLPFRQEVEIRREMPALDFLAGSVIRGRFDITDYAFNGELPEALFMGPAVTALPEAERERFAFQEPLIPEETAAELTPTPTLQEIREQALELTAGRYLSGLSRLRLHAPSASHVFRWNRAEGSFVGLGFAWRPSGDAVLKTRGGWAFGAEKPSLAAELEYAPGHGITASWRELRDLGPFPGQVGVVNTISALVSSDDWTDPWFSSGLTWTIPRPRGSAFLVLERHDSAHAALDADDRADFRPLPSVEEGWMAEIGGTFERALTSSLVLSGTGRVGVFWQDDDGSSTPVGTTLGTLRWEHARPGASTFVARLDGGITSEESLHQNLFYLGGVGTLPGHPFREQVGEAFWLVRTDAGVPIFAPWLTLRAFAAAGGVSSGSPRVSVGPGAGLAWDVVQLELGRGLDGGEWELVVSVDRRFRGWL
jgi:hypothetical protein